METKITATPLLFSPTGLEGQATSTHPNNNQGGTNHDTFKAEAIVPKYRIRTGT